MARCAGRLIVRRVLLALAAMSVAAATLFAAAAPSAAYPQQTGTLAVTSGALRPGATVTLTGGGFAPGAAVSVYVYSSPTLLTTTRAAATGDIVVTVKLPADLAPGHHTVQAVGPAAGGGTNVLSVSFTVSSAASSGGSLPFTGFPVVTAAVVAMLLLAGGGLAVMAGRRRRRV